MSTRVITSKAVLIFALLITVVDVFCQPNLKFEKNIDFEASKKKKIQKDINEWVIAQAKYTLVPSDRDEKYILAGSIEFVNNEKYNSSETFSRLYATQTNGKIYYQFVISFENERLNLSVTDFKHLPSSKVEKIDFGVLTTSENAPENLRNDYDADWCCKVWQSMKKKSEEEATLIFDLFPGSFYSLK